MTGSRSARALKYLGASLLLLGVFEACSSDESTPDPFKDPPTLKIDSISLGNGSIGQGGDSSLLTCDETIGVTLAVSNWYAYPPGKCGSTPKCGQIRVSLVAEPSGEALATKTSASVGVNLDITQLVESGTVKAGKYAIQAELIDDAGHVYSVADGGNNTTELAFTLGLADGCATGSAGASSGGASGEGGMGGAPSFESGGASDQAGAAGAPSP